MKKHILLGLMTLALGIAITACNKGNEDQDFNDETVSVATSEDLLTLQDAVEDTEDEINLLETRGENEDGACPVITIVPNPSFPARIVTIDYGEGCEGANGRVRSGKIIIEYTEALTQEGAERKVTYENFTMDDARVEGTRVLTNNGPNEQGYITFTHAVEMTITYPDGSQASWTASHQRTQIAGTGTMFPFDDVFSITGQAAGTNRNGRSFSSIIIQPLVKRRNCRWIEAGVQQITVNNDKTLTINFGDGGCDNDALVTLPNGQTRQVKIRAWWRR